MCGEGPVERDAAAVGEGSMAIAFVHQYLEDASTERRAAARLAALDAIGRPGSSHGAISGISPDVAPCGG